MPTQAARLGQRQCPVREGHPDHCGRVVRPGHLMCPAHWREVPTPIREAVWKRWRRFNATSSDDDWAHYMEARTEALAHFDRNQPQPPPSTLSADELDRAVLVLVIAPDGRTQLWHAGTDRAKVAQALQTVYTDIITGA